jgi:hypothetical protein
VVELDHLTQGASKMGCGHSQDGRSDLLGCEPGAHWMGPAVTDVVAHGSFYYALKRDRRQAFELMNMLSDDPLYVGFLEETAYELGRHDELWLLHLLTGYVGRFGGEHRDAVARGRFKGLYMAQEDDGLLTFIRSRGTATDAQIVAAMGFTKAKDPTECIKRFLMGCFHSVDEYLDRRERLFRNVGDLLGPEKDRDNSTQRVYTAVQITLRQLHKQT